MSTIDDAIKAYTKQRINELLNTDTFSAFQLTEEVMRELRRHVTTQVQKTLQEGLATGSIELTRTMRMRKTEQS